MNDREKRGCLEVVVLVAARCRFGLWVGHRQVLFFHALLRRARVTVFSFSITLHDIVSTIVPFCSAACCEWFLSKSIANRLR